MYAIVIGIQEQFYVVVVVVFRFSLAGGLVSMVFLPCCVRVAPRRRVPGFVLFALKIADNHMYLVSRIESCLSNHTWYSSYSVENTHMKQETYVLFVVRSFFYLAAKKLSDG